MDVNKNVVISFTGTDLKQLQEIEEDKEEIIDLLNRTQVITVFHNEAREELLKEGILGEKIKIIPQTTIPMQIGYKTKEQGTRRLSQPDCVTFMLAGGIRKVKAPIRSD